MERAKLRNVDLAAALGVTPQAVGDWIKRGSISRKRLPDVARLLNVSVDWLLTGSERISVTTERVNLRAIPVLSWTQLGSHKEEEAMKSSVEFVPAPVTAGKSAFAVRMPSDAMEPLIPMGSLVVVDPDAPQTPGCIVVCRMPGDSEAICRRLLREAGRGLLTAENPRYPHRELPDDAVIVGVAKQVIRDL